MNLRIAILFFTIGGCLPVNMSANDEDLQSLCGNTINLQLYGNLAINADNSICLNGEINSELEQYIKLQIEKFPNKDYIVVDSHGGSVLSAIRISSIIKDKTVIVHGVCFSSCANYILFASDKLIVTENAKIMVHGWPSRKNCRGKRDPDICEEIILEDYFFYENSDAQLLKNAYIRSVYEYLQKNSANGQSFEFWLDRYELETVIDQAEIHEGYDVSYEECNLKIFENAIAFTDVAFEKGAPISTCEKKSPN